MTRDEYEQKYGAKPTTNQPIQMTRQQYQQKYGGTPQSGDGYRSDLTNEQYWTGTAKNILPSAGRTAMAMGSGILNMANPNIDQNTLAQTARLAYGGLQKLDPTKDKVISKGIADITPLKYVSMADKGRGMSTDYQPQANAVGNFYKDRYGGVENIKKSFYEDPTGVALDVATVASGVGGALKGAGTLANSSKLARAGELVSTAGRAIDPISITGKVGGAILKKPLSKAVSYLAKEAESLPTRGMGNPIGLAKAKGVSPLSMDQLFEKYKTWDRSPDAFQSGIDMAKEQGKTLAKTAEKAGNKVDVLKVLDAINEKMKSLVSKAKTSDKALAELEELARRKKMLVESLGEGSATRLKASPAKITEIKQNFQADVPDSAFGQPMSEMNKASGTRKAYQSLIGGIEEAVPGTKNLGREESALIKLKEIAKNQEARLGARQNMNFSRLGGAGVGGLVAGVPGAIQGYILEQIVNSPQFLRLASKGARGISNIKLPRSNIFKTLINTGKVTRMTNPK